MDRAGVLIGFVRVTFGTALRDLKPRLAGLLHVMGAVAADAGRSVFVALLELVEVDVIQHPREMGKVAAIAGLCRPLLVLRQRW